MAQIRIDISSRILSEDHRVFLIRPGKGSKLYPSFTSQSKVGPELPNLDLEDGVVFSKQPDFLAKLLRSIAIRRWIRAGRIQGKNPSRDLADYKALKQNLSHVQHRAIVEGFFEKARQGDLAVVYPSSYKQDVYIGEFVDTPSKITSIQVPEQYGQEDLSGRRVRWLATFNKRELPISIFEIIEKPNALVLLPDYQNGFFYNRAYASYTIGQNVSAKFNVSEDVFTVSDDIQIQAFFKQVAANQQRIDQNSDDLLSIVEAVFSDIGNYSLNLATNINSPGYLDLSSNKLTALVAAALLAVALAVDPVVAVNAANNGMLVIGNSAAPDGDKCTGLVHKQTIQHIRMLGLDKWPEACEKARAAAEKVGLQSPATVTHQ